MKDEFTAAIERYLESRGTTLWGRAFDVKSEEGKEKAVAWLIETVDGVLRSTDHPEHIMSLLIANLNEAE